MPIPTVLLTAFEPYDHWATNASWLTVIELTKELPDNLNVTTRLYPVDFERVRAMLADDLVGDYDVAIHLGQAPGGGTIGLEAIGINVAGRPEQMPGDYLPLADDGPTAYRSKLPLTSWARLLRANGYPARVSYHAGTFLCNATLYYSHYLADMLSVNTLSAFIHVPLDTSQVVEQEENYASQPVVTTAGAIRLILEELAGG